MNTTKARECARTHLLTSIEVKQRIADICLDEIVAAADLIAARDGIRIFEWETYGLGDAMWDVDCQVAGVHELEDVDVAAVFAAYEQMRPVDRQRFRESRENWAARLS